MNFKKIIASVCSAAIMTLTFAGCTIIDNSVIATVDGAKITRGEFQYYVQNILLQKEYYTQVPEGQTLLDMEVDGKKMSDIIKEEALDMLIEMKVVANQAKKDGISLAQENRQVLDETKSSMIKNYGGKEAYVNALKDIGLTEELFDQIMEESTLQGQILTQRMEAIEVSDEEAKAEFENKYIRAKHILIAFDNETPPQDAEVKAQEILDKINAGADFDALMNEHSTDPGLQTDPDGYVFTTGRMVKEFEEAAFALEIGQVSGLVKTDYGYHIIKRETLPADKFEENKQTVIAAIQEAQVNEYIESLKANAKIEKNEKNYNNFKVEKIELE